ncbi:MAG: hypothetical protein ACOCX1_02025 [Fimbriimonadaceae bacterium]
MRRNSGEVDPKVIGLAVVIVIAVGFLAWYGLQGSESAQVNEGLETSQFIADLAAKSGGDLSQLTEEEVDRCQELTNNECESTLRFHPNSGGGVGTGVNQN